MHVVSFMTQKGGSGKSTTCASIAVAAFQTGRRVFILDMDEQGTMSQWIDTRGEQAGPDFEEIKAADLAKALPELKKAGYDLVFIDTPGKYSPDNNAVMRVSDLVLIPCRPTAPDLRGCVPTVEALMTLKKPFAFVLNQCIARSPRVEETRTGLSALGMCADPPIVSRTDHQDAMAQGIGVTEFNPKGEAAREINELLDWVDKKLSPKVKRHGS